MLKLSILLIVTALAVATGDYNARTRGLIHQIQKGVAGPNPYIFLTVPKGRSQSVIQGFEVIEEDDDDQKHKNLKRKKMDDFEENYGNDNNEDDDNEGLNEEEDDDEQMNNTRQHLNKVENNENEEDEEDEDIDEFDNIMKTDMKVRKPAKATQIMVTRQHTGAIMVPDQIIEIEAQTIIDEKTGKAALLLPRSILDSIPDGSIVALMERPNSEESEGRANRVIVRRRRKGSRRNLKRRSGGNTRYRVVQQNGNRRRNNIKRQNVIVVRRRNGNSKQHAYRRRINLQG